MLVGIWCSGGVTVRIKCLIFHDYCKKITFSLSEQLIHCESESLFRDAKKKKNEPIVLSQGVMYEGP